LKTGTNPHSDLRGGVPTLTDLRGLPPGDFLWGLIGLISGRMSAVSQYTAGKCEKGKEKGYETEDSTTVVTRNNAEAWRHDAVTS